MLKKSRKDNGKIGNKCPKILKVPQSKKTTLENPNQIKDGVMMTKAKIRDLVQKLIDEAVLRHGLAALQPYSCSPTPTGLILYDIFDALKAKGITLEQALPVIHEVARKMKILRYAPH